MLQRAAKSVVVLTLAVMLLGADRPPTSLHGSWSVDVDKMVEAMKKEEGFQKAPPEVQKAREADFRKEMAGATATFSADGKLVLDASDDKDEITYKIVSREGDGWKIETTEQRQNAPLLVVTVTVAWADDDHITLTGPDGFPVCFVRKK